MGDTSLLFDKSLEYDQMLNQGLALSGEDKFYFVHGRYKDLQQTLPSNYKVKRILDFGCGIGDSTILLKDYFPEAEIIGIDTAAEAIKYANANNNLGGKASYYTLEKFNQINEFDLCFVNGVFHHIPPAMRDETVKKIHDSLNPGAFFALFENNPHNPGTRMVMKRIPFDKDAITLTPKECRGLMIRNGFKPYTKTRFLFYFPRALSFLRSTERYFVHLPLGAQYYNLMQK